MGPERTHGSAQRARPHWVIAELDARGAIDEHATMCLEHAIDGALTCGARTIVVDLRDLASIDAAGLTLFMRAHADCDARGVDLGLLVSSSPRHYAIVDALDAAGLCDQIDFTWDPVRAPARTRGLDEPAPALRGARVRAAAARLSRRRLRGRGSPGLRHD